MGRRIHSSTQMGTGSRAHVSTAACKRVEIVKQKKQAERWRHTATHAHTCAHTLPYKARLLRLRMCSPMFHRLSVMTRGLWAGVKIIES